MVGLIKTKRSKRLVSKRPRVILRLNRTLLSGRLVKSAVLIGLVILPFYAIFTVFKVKQASCLNLPEADQALINPIITSVFVNKPLFSISLPQVKSVFDNLYLWEVEKMDKRYPDQLNLKCRRLENRYYLYLTDINKAKTPISLSDWLEFGKLVVSLEPKSATLVIFQPQVGRLTIIPKALPTSNLKYDFITNKQANLISENLWKIYFWLTAFRPKPDKSLKVFVNQDISLIYDPDYNLFYLLDPNNLPDPNNLTKFINQAGSGLRLIDWRLKRVIVI